jgi:hypothetical protein
MAIFSLSDRRLAPLSKMEGFSVDPMDNRLQNAVGAQSPGGAHQCRLEENAAGVCKFIVKYQRLGVQYWLLHPEL